MKLTRFALLRLMIHKWPAGGFSVSLPWGDYPGGTYCQGSGETSGYYWFQSWKLAVRAVIKASWEERRKHERANLAVIQAAGKEQPCLK